jgi:hypothetical protein
MVRSYSEFLARLNEIDWSPAGHIDPCVLGLLEEVGRKPSLLRELVVSWSEEDLEERGLRCNDTSTHYKWFLHYDRYFHYRVWLHQYKSRGARRMGYAEVPHNHRYSLASVILDGGFAHRVFERNGARLREVTEARRNYQRGDVYIVRHDEIHRLSDLCDGTMTLVVETPLVRHFSEAFYGENCDAVRFYDFVGRHNLLSEAMEAICQDGALA